MERIRYLVNVLIVALLLLTVAVQRDARLFGVATSDLLSPSEEESSTVVDRVDSEGRRVVSSVLAAKGISGFGGATPVEIYIKEGRIVDIVAGDNGESSDFMGAVEASALLDRWDGLTVEEALSLEVDGVSGATLSSRSLIATVRKTLEYAAGSLVEGVADAPFRWDVKSVVGLLVVLLGLLFSWIGTRAFRWVQLVLNVVVLGFWCGSFLSLSLLVNWFSSGVNVAISLVPLSLLVVALLLPFFSRKGHYCAWHCPMGSLQELASKVPLSKWSMSRRWVDRLSLLREIIFWGLLSSMWLGVGFDWMDYELFSAFLFESVGWVVLCVAILFILLSMFVHRPYCRFVCPTGSLLRFCTVTK